MLCYKDMTFCTYWEGCIHGDVCKRAFTKEHKDAAAHAKLLVSQFGAKPECFKEKADED